MSLSTIEKRVLEFARIRIPMEALVGIKELKQWKGKRIFVPVFDEPVFIGEVHIEVDNEKINLVSGEEAIMYQEFYVNSLTPDELEKERKELEEFINNSEETKNNEIK